MKFKNKPTATDKTLMLLNLKVNRLHVGIKELPWWSDKVIYLRNSVKNKFLY